MISNKSNVANPNLLSENSTKLQYRTRFAKFGILGNPQNGAQGRLGTSLLPTGSRRKLGNFPKKYLPNRQYRTRIVCDQVGKPQKGPKNTKIRNIGKHLIRP